jgi:alpha-tubulin suppressor-like RCC1 family protein
MADSLAAGELKLTSVAGNTNIGLLASSNKKYCLGIMSPNIKDLSRNVFYSTSDDPSRVMRGTNIPAACGTPVAFAPVGVDTSGAVAPVLAPVVTGTLGTPTKADFTWTKVPGAIGYKVEQQINTGAWTVVTPSQPGTSISVTALEGDLVNIRVTAINHHGESAPSNVAVVPLPNATPVAYAAWGMNTTSQLNDGTAVTAMTPVKMLQTGALAGRKIDYVKSGNGFSCALSQGKAFCWGRGDYGQIGNGASVNVVDPVEINMTAIGTNAITSLSVGDNHSCVIANSEVYCWGHNGMGKLGRGTSGGISNIPVKAAGELAGLTVTAVEAGINSTCAISSGKAYCWGYNQYSQIKAGAGSTVTAPIAVDDTGALSGVNVTAVSPLGYQTCLLGDGKVYCWGTSGGTGIPNYTTAPHLLDPTGLMSGKTVTSLESGANHSCAIADSRVYCWGQNLRNQLGDASGITGSYNVVVDPYGVLDVRPVTALSVGEDSSCAIADGKVYCWGYNASGQIGDGTTSMRSTPTPVVTSTALSGKTAMTVHVGQAGVFVGYNNTVPATTTRPPSFEPDFSTAAWGENQRGGLGDGTLVNALSPTSVLNSGALAGKKISAMESGNSHSCAISEGELYCWGYNVVGQLGNLGTVTSPIPVKVFSDGWLRGKTVTDISLGSNYTCAIADGKAYCWGVKAQGGTGNNTFNYDYKAPVPVSGLLAGKTVKDIDAGNVHTCAVADGAAYCWGYNTEGELGNGDTTRTSSFVPVAVSTAGVLSGKTVTSVTAGTWASCAIADGQAHCWGNNQHKQLGAVTSGSSSDVPVAVTTTGVLAGKTVTNIAMGAYHTCATASDNRMYCWGNNTSGELGTGATTMWTTNPMATHATGLLNGKTVTGMSVGNNHSCALTSEGKVYCWGFGDVGKLGTGGTSGSNTPLLVTDTGVLSGITVKKLWSGQSSTFVGY